MLLLGGGRRVTVGAPRSSGARVLGTIAEQGRAPKIVVFRYKAKTRSRKKTGHRQHFTQIVIDDILRPAQEPKPKEERRARPAAPVRKRTEEPAQRHGRGSRPRPKHPQPRGRERGRRRGRRAGWRPRPADEAPEDVAEAARSAAEAAKP